MTGSTRSAGFPVLLMLCAAGFAHSAKAQLIKQYFPDDLPGYAPDFSESVLNRMYIQQTSPGVQLGDCIIRPELDENAGYDSDTLGKAGSASATLESKASLATQSDWEVETLNLGLYLDNFRYFNVPSASYTNWQANAAGSFALGSDRLDYSYSHSAFNLAATDLGVIGVTTPVGYAVDDARVAYWKRFARFSLTPSFEFENFAFGRSAGQAGLNYDTINHRAEHESIAGSYEASPGNSAILVLRSSQAQFPNATQDSYLDLAAFSGIDFKGDGIVQARILGGIESRRCSCREESTITIPTFEIGVTWMPTELDTLNATGIRRLDDPVSPFALDSKIWDGKLSLYHELRRNVFLTGAAEIEHSDSEFATDTSGGEKQTQLSFSIAALWDIRANVSATIGYSYNKTASHSDDVHFTALDGTYPNFYRHTISIGIRFDE